MKKQLYKLTKHLTFIGLGLNLSSFVLVILSAGNYPDSGEAYGQGMMYWIYSVIIALLCVCIYFTEALWSFLGERNTYSTVKLIAVTVALLLLLLVGATLDIMCIIIWNVCFGALFIFELVLLLRSFRHKAKTEN